MADLLLDGRTIRAHNEEPVTKVNPPFQRRIGYRPDDYSALRYKLLQHLAEALPRWNRELAAHQGPRDFGVLMAELFAYTGEILGFYQDCRANESFLRTAVLPSSLIDLCELIGYRIPPGAAASVLQVFICKDGKGGLIPSGFQVKTKPKAGQPTMIFETGVDLAADASRNTLRIAGWNQSTRVLNATGASAESSVLLDQGYGGLEAGSFAVFSAPGKREAVRIAAVTEENGKRRISWDAADLHAGWNVPIASLAIAGKPAQEMKLAESARADELAIGQLSAGVSDASIFAANDKVIFASPGAMNVASISNIAGQMISWDRGFASPLRRSETVVYTAGHDAFADAVAQVVGVPSAAINVGDRVIKTNPLSLPAPVAGDLIVISGDGHLDAVRVAAVSGDYYYLADAAPRTYMSASLFKATLANGETGTAGSPHTTLLSLRVDPARTEIVLDKTYDGLTPGSLLVLSDGAGTRVNDVAAVRVDDQNRTVLTLQQPVGVSFRTAALTIYGPFKLDMRVDAFNVSEESVAAGVTSLMLDGAVAGISPGAYLILESATHTEGVRIAEITPSAAATTTDLEHATVNSFPKGTTVIYGNVVPATLGETVIEIALGSGDQSIANQTFALHKKPITFVHDPAGPRGVINTLELFVDDVKWIEVESLADSGPDDRHYATRIDEDQLMSVVFGDGVHGAKPATGRDNIRAEYRTGIGAQSNVGSGEIQVLAAAPDFLKLTRNPLPAAGGADRETPDQLKEAAPITVRTMDRAVSAGDFQELALSYAGISKARASWVRIQGRNSIRLVVATVGGKPLNAPLRTSLAAFLDARRAPGNPVVIADYQAFPVRLELEVSVLPEFAQAGTRARVLAALGGEGFFHLDRRGLGDDLYLSDVYATVEAIEGVDYVVATAFRPEQDAAAPVLDVVAVPPDGVATAGTLHVRAAGGIV